LLVIQSFDYLKGLIMSKIAIIPTKIALQHFKNRGLKIVHRDPKIASIRQARLRRQQPIKPEAA
jgi:hypothetical protein